RVAVLCRHLCRRPVWSTEDDRHFNLPATHRVGFRRIADDLIEGNETEVPRHELDDGPEPRHRGPDSDPRKAGLRDRRVDNPPLTKLGEQPLRDLISAIVMTDLFAHQKDAIVSPHLFEKRLTQSFTIRNLAHLRTSPP